MIEMKNPDYAEGPKAFENFERGMKALFKVPKTDVVQPKKKKSEAASLRKPQRSGED